MFCYQIRTYIDITRSRADRETSDEIAVGQISNFNTFLQGIGLRANITWNTDPVKINKEWHWEFYTEQADVFKDETSSVGLLLKDLDGIPIISNLTNEIAIYPSVIRTLDKDVNTWIYNIPTKLS